MMSYDGEGSTNAVSTKEKVTTVKNNVNSVLGVITEQKKQQLEAQTMKTDMALEERMSGNNTMMMMRKGVTSTTENRCANETKRMSRRHMFVGGKSAAPAVATTFSCSSASSVASACGGAAAVRSFGSSIGAPTPTPTSTRPTAYASVESAPAPTTGTKAAPNITKSLVATMNTHTECDNEQNTIDFTMIPKLLDGTIEAHDKDGALRLTTVETSTTGWTRNRQRNLLTKSEVHVLTRTDILSEKKKAFDLLDALSRSGSLAISFSELHVVICATHSFEKNVMETVIVDNINPIEKLEMSTLLMASTILDIPARDLLRKEEERERLALSFPRLLNHVPSSRTPTVIPTLEDKSTSAEI